MFDRSSFDADSSRAGRWGVLAVLALFLSLGVPSVVQAQGGMGQGQRQSIMKIRQINKQLSQIRQQAMQDSALQARQQQLSQRIMSELRSMDDSTAARVERMSTLQENLRTAQQQQDTAGARSAVRELRKLNQALGPARKKVLQRPEIRKQVQAFQEELRSEMNEVNPKADSLRSVADSLTRQLQSGMGGGPGGSR